MIKSTFAKVRFERTANHFLIEVLPQVVCSRSGQGGVKQTAEWGENDGAVRYLPPAVRTMPIGSVLVRKVRLRTIGYDRCDRAVTG